MEGPIIKRTEKDILRDVKAIAVEYYEKTRKPLGVTGEIAEFEASEKLGLELADARSPGYDALRRRGKRKGKIQIKGRWKRDGTKWGRVSKIDITKEFDSVVLVLMHRDYEVLEIWEADRGPVVERLTAPGSKSRNERGSMGVSQFKSIAQKIWPS